MPHDNKLLSEIKAKMDSLEKKSKNKLWIVKPFNPNYISDYKAYRLGMSVDEIDRLFTFRKKGLYINSNQDFQKVTHVSDSLLAIISIHFKFPKWIDKSKKITKRTVKKLVIKDINTATVNDLIKVKGIAEKRAVTILKYRKLLGGFSIDTQLNEIWGVPKEVVVQLKKEFKVLSKPLLNKLNVNKATVSELNRLVYISYKQAKSIVEYRQEVAEIQNLAELKTISNFPVDKFDLISLYLQAQ